MWRRPRFKSHFQVEIVEPDLLFLLSETGTQVIEGRLPVLLGPYLDGRHRFEDIVDKLRGRAGPLDVRYGLELLAEEKCLAEGGSGRQSEAEKFAEAIGAPGERLKRSAVEVETVGNVERERFVRMLETVGITVRKKADFLVVLTDDYLREELAEWNRRAIAGKRTWMLVRPTGVVLGIGPIVRLPETACWECLAKRLREHRQAEAWLEARRRGEQDADSRGARKREERRSIPRTVTLESSREAALGIAATEALKQILQGRNEALWGKMATLDVRSLAWATHRVVKQRDCAACGKRGEGKLRAGRRVVLQARMKISLRDGGYRAARPEETFAAYEHHISAVSGIVRRIEIEEEGESGISVYLAEHVFPRIAPARRFPPTGFERWSAGKGITRQQARISALGEALERYSGVFHGDEPRRTARLSELGASAIEPGKCLLFSERQYRERERRNERGSLYNWVASRFEPERRIEWTPVWSLTRKEFRYVPTAYCYYGYPLPEEHEFCRADSNGCAAGGNLEEAILQGFLEVVERDAVAIWWYNRIRRPGVDLGSFEQPFFARLVEQYKKLGRVVDVLDVRSDFGIPVFVAVSRVRGRGNRGLLLGFGAHPDAEIAIGRALAEMNQFLPEARLGRQRVAYDNRLAEAKFLVPSRALPLLRAGDYERAPEGDIREDVERCVARARRLGLETLVLDQTRPDVEMPVARVIVPGMRSFWARFAPGRLYEVPVQLGWRRKSCDEQKLNPAHLSI